MTSSPGPSEFKDMLDALTRTDAIFKLQHKDEPDLSIEEKRDIASGLLSSNPGQFLFRFGRYLKPDHLLLFEQFRLDYAVDHYLNENAAAQTAPGRRRTAALSRNRRLAAVEDMMDEGDYFTELEMKKRDPRLYEEMVGKYMTEEEKLALENSVGTSRDDQKLSTILTEHMMLEQRRAVGATDAMANLGVQDDSDEEESEEDSREGGVELPVEEKKRLREEFRDIMVERFIGGKDDDFDYEGLDRNPRYTSDAIEEQDAEDAYFDAEDPADALVDE